MAAVRTTNGTLLKADRGDGTKDRKPNPLTEDEAKALADARNRDAERLGLKVRYEATAS